MTWIPRACPKPAPTPPKARTRPTAKRGKPRRIQGIKCPELVAHAHSWPCHLCDRHQRNTFFGGGVFVTGMVSIVEASHMPKSKRFGDWNNVIPLCAWHHRLAADSWHLGRKAFLAAHQLSLSAVAQLAREYTARFVHETGFRPPEVR